MRLLTSILADVDYDSTPETPRYWDLREELDYQFEFNERGRVGLPDMIETEGFHEHLDRRFQNP